MIQAIPIPKQKMEQWLRNLMTLHFINSKPSHIHLDPEINLGHGVNKCQRHRDREQCLLKRRKAPCLYSLHNL
jgi:hypothetical protein